eukprot:TRINITY_DN36491_c0_g2_i4.p2 TRINITY_DN36491_c0_g2~~TRINITY_DN36491_c0_g2_i4.p2  ORF type:complete len:201 (+),score=11.76 TRINITY_DN36491_c0_g2_i4:138-740(+)
MRNTSDINVVAIRSSIRECLTQLAKLQSNLSKQCILGLQLLENFVNLTTKQTYAKQLRLGNRNTQQSLQQSGQFYNYQEKDFINEIYKVTNEIQKEIVGYRQKISQVQKIVQEQSGAGHLVAFKKLSINTFIDLLTSIEDEYSKDFSTKLTICDQLSSSFEKSTYEKQQLEVWLWIWMMQPALNEQNIAMKLKLMQQELV